MRRIAHHQAVWILSASLVTLGIGSAQETTRPGRAPATVKPAPVTVDLLAPPIVFRHLPEVRVEETSPSAEKIGVVSEGSAPTPTSVVSETVAATCETCENPWAKIPPVTVFPRPGAFTVPGSGPGYYSFCDVLEGNYRKKPPAFPYPPFILQAPSNFDADYRYLDKPDNQQTDFFDATKRLHPTPDTMFSFGGQHSIRYMDEVDSRLGKVDNTYSLIRNRVYGDFWYKDNVRIYGEFISAITTGQNLPPLAIDQNKADFLNLFVDVKAAEIAGNPLYVRVGRQELLYGSQRIVSTLDWANTRRTFEGVKAFWHSEKVDVDAFWTQPVVIAPNEFDSANHDVQFYGVWATYRPAKGQFIDLYYLGLTDDRATPNPFVQGKAARKGTQDAHTFGARWAGNQGRLLYDFEGMLQTGNFIGRDRSAYAWTTAIGWEFKETPWRPQLWVSNDYASGTSNPSAGDYHTFNQLFPFGHYYFGFVDAVGRQNINDFNLQLAVYPDNWITLLVQYHNFQLAERRDFLYNAAGRATRRSATGAAGRDVGDEVDFLANFHLSQHQDVLVGYSKLFAGDFIKRTGAAVSPELLYVMYNFRW